MTKKKPEFDTFTGELYHYLKETNINPSPIFPKNLRRRNTTNSLYEARITLTQSQTKAVQEENTID